jgi:hypothetical protein
MNKIGSRVIESYPHSVYIFPFIICIIGNAIIIIIIICNKDMRNVPNMYILNLAVSDIISLTAMILDDWKYSRNVTGLEVEIFCAFIIFCGRMAVSLAAYSIAVLSIQRYRVTLNPLYVHISSQPTWCGTGAIICGVWIVAVLSSIPTVRSLYRCFPLTFLMLTDNYYFLLAIFNLLISCVLPLCVIAFSYIMTARHLVKSSFSLLEETQNPQLNTRRNTAKVVLGLTLLFVISSVPYHILDIYISSRSKVEILFVKDSDEIVW